MGLASFPSPCAVRARHGHPATGTELLESCVGWPGARGIARVPGLVFSAIPDKTSGCTGESFGRLKMTAASSGLSTSCSPWAEKCSRLLKCQIITLSRLTLSNSGTKTLSLVHASHNLSLRGHLGMCIVSAAPKPSS